MTTMTSATPTFVRPSQAAPLLGVSTKTVCRWVAAGHVPSELLIVTLGGHYRLRLRGLLRWARPDDAEALIATHDPDGGE